MQKSQMQRSVRGKISNDTVAKDFAHRTVTVEPGCSITIGLGAYRDSAPAPSFELETEDQVRASLERLDIPGASKYALFYQLHNAGQRACEVTVRRQTA